MVNAAWSRSVRFEKWKGFISIHHRNESAEVIFFFQYFIYLRLRPDRAYKWATASAAKFIDRMCRAAYDVDRGRSPNYYSLLNLQANFVRNESAGI